MVCVVPNCSRSRAQRSPVCDQHRLFALSRRGLPRPAGADGPTAESVIIRVAGRCRIDDGGCWIYPKTDAAGYAHKVSADGPNTSAHRAILLAVNPPPTRNLDAAHLCANRPCCNPEHLTWMTRSQNCATRRVPPRPPYNPTCCRCGQNPKYKPHSWCRPCINAYYRARRVTQQQ